MFGPDKPARGRWRKTLRTEICKSASQGDRSAEAEAHLLVPLTGRRTNLGSRDGITHFWGRSWWQWLWRDLARSVMFADLTLRSVTLVSYVARPRKTGACLATAFGFCGSMTGVRTRTQRVPLRGRASEGGSQLIVPRCAGSMRDAGTFCSASKETISVIDLLGAPFSI